MLNKNNQEEQNRLNRLNEIRSLGINPYPEKYNKNHRNSEVINSYNNLEQRTLEGIIEKPQRRFSIAGRIMTWRRHGKIIFSQIQDFSGRIQVAFLFNVLGKEKFEILEIFDIGDFIGIEGDLFKTKKGEVTVLAIDYKLLSKTLKPLPEKWHGLKDEEARFRRRYLDILFNPEVKGMILRKEKFWHTIREFLSKKEFIEVETPILETTPSGADAEAFQTHINDYDMDVYLRISIGELWQKRLMVAGFEKTFEIGRQFRNEGTSAEHLQEYTQMECYWAYAGYRQMMNLMKTMYQEIAQNIYGTTKFKIKNFEIDLSADWPKIDYADEIKKQTGGIDVFSATKRELKNKLKELKIKYDEKLGRGRLIDSLWKSCRKNIKGPAFLVNHPIEISPLAKRNEDNPKIVNRFQIIIAGSEIGNGYSELNDPIEQEKRFREQAKLREQGDLEAQMHDKEFVEALKYGMPPTAGFGVSERLFWSLENKPARECVIFPLMKKKEAIN